MARLVSHAFEHMMNAVKASPESAANAFLVIRPHLAHAERAALARAALGDAHADQAITKALESGAAWRQWMNDVSQT